MSLDLGEIHSRPTDYSVGLFFYTLKHQGFITFLMCKYLSLYELKNTIEIHVSA